MGTSCTHKLFVFLTLVPYRDVKGEVMSQGPVRLLQLTCAFILELGTSRNIRI